MCQYLVLNAEQKHIYMKILHRKDAYKSESMQLDYFQKNLFLYPTINEQIPKGNQKDRDISSL